MFNKQLNAFNYKQTPYALHYPTIVNTMEQMPCYPVYNTIADNTACRCGAFLDFDLSKLCKRLYTRSERQTDRQRQTR